MRFAFTHEQAGFADAVAKCISRNVPTWPDPQWANLDPIVHSLMRTLAEVGLPEVLLPEPAGGAGTGVVDSVPAAIVAGEHFVPYPIAETVVAARLFAAMRHEGLTQLRDGSAIAAIAWDSKLSIGVGGAVTGDVEHVTFAKQARWLIAQAQTDDARDFTVVADLESPAVERVSLAPFDPTAPVSRVRLNRAQPGAILEDISEWRRCVQIARILHSADIVGCASAGHVMATGYLSTRSQFGRAIGQNQVLRHLMADDHLRLENCRLAVAHAAWAFDSGDASCDRSTMTAKAYVSRAGRQILENAIQVHGGIGFTWDLPLHVLLRRTVRLGGVLGTSPQLFAELGRTFSVEQK